MAMTSRDLASGLLALILGAAPAAAQVTNQGSTAPGPVYAEATGEAVTPGDLIVTGDLYPMSAQYVDVRYITAAGAVTVLPTDYVILVNKTSGAATTVNLPSLPKVGRMLVIKDGKGDAATNNITLTPATGTVDGAATFVMATNWQSITLVYTGAEWSVQ